MTLHTLETITIYWIALAVIIHVVLHFVAAPFGRHTSAKWGYAINNQLGWFIMELPSWLIMLYFLWVSLQQHQSLVWIVFIPWLLHYTNRTFVYPLRIRATPKKMPLLIVGNAIFFNLVNAGLNGYYLAVLAPPEQYGIQWLGSFHFIAGLVIFLSGMYINLRADHILIHLRARGETDYKIPKGFLFDLVSSPNLFGEIVEWSGFALMAWNLPALSFMIWTLANLVPRAINHHNWYRKNFAEYPADRKIVFPYLF